MHNLQINSFFYICKKKKVGKKEKKEKVKLCLCEANWTADIFIYADHGHSRAVAALYISPANLSTESGTTPPGPK